MKNAWERKRPNKFLLLLSVAFAYEVDAIMCNEDKNGDSKKFSIRTNLIQRKN